MARIVPSGWQELAAAQPAGALQREIDTLSLLARALPDTYTVFHGVHWTRVHDGTALAGEIDFAIVSAAGDVLLIEQKTGFLDETPDGLATLYGRTRHNVPAQLARHADALRQRLAHFCKRPVAALDTLFYCPDHTLKSPGTAGIDPARIVDAGRREQLAAIITAILPDQPPQPATAEPIRRFFGEMLQLVPEVNAVVGEADALYTRLAGGLAEWGRQLDFSPFRLRVLGTAGAGKTQLAMAVYRDTLAAGKRPLFVCFNRPLADHVARIAPPGGVVTSYHQFCRQLAEARGSLPDFSRPDAFAALERAFDEHAVSAAEQFDTVIVDEGQDFKQGWAENLLRLLAPGGRAWWLEDPLQNLYGRTPVSLPGWVTLHADTNYRSPRDLLAALNRLLAPARPIAAGSPLSGMGIELLTYTDDADLIAQTKRAITSAIGAGFKRSMIALLTYRGREQSRLASAERLGPYPLKRFTGRYDLLGSPEISDGDVLIESVLRFKGQSAPCVILTEIDFATLDDNARRRLFVGATRASMKLTLIAQEGAGRQLADRLAADAP